MIQVIREVENFDMEKVGETKHLEERTHRNKGGEKTIEHIFEILRNGRLQLHIILSDATVVVVDKERNKIVTLLNARPQQIKRYFQPLNKTAPSFLLESAMTNVVNNYNML